MASETPNPEPCSAPNDLALLSPLSPRGQGEAAHHTARLREFPVLCTLSLDIEIIFPV